MKTGIGDRLYQFIRMNDDRTNSGNVIDWDKTSSKIDI